MVPIIKFNQDLSRVFSRSQLDSDEINKSVKEIVKNVREKGDTALFDYTNKFDKITLTKENIEVTKQEIEKAYTKVDESLLKAIRIAKDNIYNFHKRNLRTDSLVKEDGLTTGYVVRAVESAGIYVPGGKASYPSSVLMCALPALAAGVKNIVMVTPGGQYLNPVILVAANECGIKRIFKVGGAQAVAALAFGTESIPKVDVISGPGNIYVATAKKEVFGYVGIDMIAGPSEILILADDSATPEFLAADMLSQAEHDELAMSLLITNSEKLAKQVNEQLKIQIEKLPKSEIAKKSLLNYGTIIVCEDYSQMIELSNRVAPEHLELCVKEPYNILKEVTNAGAVFLGNYSPEPLGDYMAGPNHVLPTSSTARFFSALSTDNYIKKISVIDYSKNALAVVKDDIITFAESEFLQAHANSIDIRFKEISTKN